MSHNTESIFKAIRFAQYSGNAGNARVRDDAAKGKVKALQDKRHYRPQNRKEGVYNPVVNTQGLSSWTEEDRQRQLRLTERGGRMGLRDQSEDRTAPKWLVQYQEGKRLPWQVVRASDQHLAGEYAKAEHAVKLAVALEAQG